MAKRRRTSITRARVRAGISRAKGALQRLDRYRAESERVVGQVVQTLEVQAGAFGFGWVNGRYGDTDVAGIPVDIGAAALLHLIGFTRLAGKYSEHAHNLGDGALSVFSASKGAEIGARMAQEADETAGIIVGGVPRGALGSGRRGLHDVAASRAVNHHARI